MRRLGLAFATALTLLLTACDMNAPAINTTNESAVKAEEAKQEEEASNEMAKRESDIRSNHAEEKARELTSGYASENSEGVEDGLLLAKDEWPKNELTSLVPEPRFSVPLESVGVNDGENAQSVSGGWRNATQEEVANYVQKVKDAGFNVDMSENSDNSTYSFSAGNAKSGTNGRVTIHVRFAEMSDFTMSTIYVSRITL